MERLGERILWEFMPAAQHFPARPHAKLKFSLILYIIIPFIDTTYAHLFHLFEQVRTDIRCSFQVVAYSGWQTTQTI